MILTIDSGNTTLSLALVKGTKILKRSTIEMHQPKASCGQPKATLRSSLASILESLYKKYPLISAVVLCSVVPSVVPLVCRIVKASLGLKTLVIGRDLFVPIKNNYRYPQQVGQDRLVSAYAAKELYGHPAIVIDLGTAMTFDIVSASGAYEGGMIVPGVRLAAEALHEHTALLPKVHLDRVPKNFIGKDTESSILSGIYNGYGSLCAGLIKRIAAEMKHKPKVIATGGYVRLMKKFFQGSVDVVDYDLMFKGLQFIYENRIDQR